MQWSLRHESAEPLDRLLVSGLARKYHQDHPAQLLDIGLLGPERQQPLDHDLALHVGEHARALESQQEATALDGEPRRLAIGEYAHRLRVRLVPPRFLRLPLARMAHRKTLVPEGELGKPIE